MKLLFLGDFYYDYESVEPDDLKKIEKYIAEKNYTVVLNYEGAPGNGGIPIEKRGPNLRHSSLATDILKKMNVQVACLANNHSMDFGSEALINGINKLNKAGISIVGAGENVCHATKPLIITENNQTIIIQNFGWDVEETVYATDSAAGCAPLNHDYILEQTKQLKDKYPSAVIINVFHWGFEFNTLPMPIDINLAHKCIDAGADIIIGHHPHVVQPSEIYHGKPIFYSLGNFYFSSRRDTFTRKFTKEKYDNMCDYGIGVVYDTDDGTFECIQIEYKPEEKISILSENVTCISDITGLDWTTEDYITMAKEHSSGINPILGMNEEYNQKALRKLFFRYAVSKRIAFLKKNKVGKIVYGFLKKVSN